MSVAAWIILAVIVVSALMVLAPVLARYLARRAMRKDW